MPAAAAAGPEPGRRPAAAAAAAAAATTANSSSMRVSRACVGASGFWQPWCLAQTHAGAALPWCLAQTRAGTVLPWWLAQTRAGAVLPWCLTQTRAGAVLPWWLAQTRAGAALPWCLAQTRAGAVLPWCGAGLMRIYERGSSSAHHSPPEGRKARALGAQPSTRTLMLRVRRAATKTCCWQHARARSHTSPGTRNVQFAACVCTRVRTLLTGRGLIGQWHAIDGQRTTRADLNTWAVARC